MLFKQAARLERIYQVDDLWNALVDVLKSVGFEHAIHISVDANFGAPQVRCTMPGLYDHMPPQDDPFLHHACKSYTVLTIGTAFLDQYPNIKESERAFITRAGAAGFRAGFAMPMRLQGSDRFGGFIIGTGLDRASFESRFLPRVEEVHLFCLLMHRRIEDLTGTAPLSQPQLPPAFDALSPRERQVIGLLAHGETRKRTAEVCGLSIHTVSDYAKTGYRKLGIRNRAQAAAMIHAAPAGAGLDDPGPSPYLWHQAAGETPMTKPPLTLYLAAPRGFCAGVDRAIKIVEMAIEKWGAPVYVRHEIVHNKFVVDGLRDKGAIFVEELSECPDDRPVIFSAHGVPKSVPSAAQARNMVYVDATCPLVSKVHIEAQRHADAGLQMIMIGHAGHPETIGTMGQLPDGDVLLVETPQDVAQVDVRDAERLAYVTQTTLSVDDTAEIVAALKARFPAIIGPHKEDICYATTNRQEAVKAMAPKCDAMLVVGAPNSSNSRRLVEVGSRAGCAYAQLVQRADNIDWRALDGISSIGITAGASAPEVLINEVIAAFEARYDVTTELVETAQENVEFKVPRVLRTPA